MVSAIVVDGKESKVESGDTIENTFRKLGYNPSAFLFQVDGNPLPMDTKIEDGMTVRQIKVASGG